MHFDTKQELKLLKSGKEVQAEETKEEAKQEGLFTRGMESYKKRATRQG